jgi:phage terminase large subunit-like protein
LGEEYEAPKGMRFVRSDGCRRVPGLSLLFERRLVHVGNPLLRWAVGNLVFMEDASGNRRPHKAKSIDRIDPAVAAIMSTGRAAANASGSSSYVTEKWAEGLAFA